MTTALAIMIGLCAATWSANDAASSLEALLYDDTAVDVLWRGHDGINY
jgi:hypothetical protein